MPILTNPPLTPALSALIIDEVGAKAIADACSMTIGGVYFWKTRGIPKFRADFLRLKFPKLEAWKKLDRS